MRSIATDGVAWSVCLSVGHVCETGKNCWTDRDSGWGADLRSPRNHVSKSRLEIPMGRAILEGCLVHWKALAVSAAVYAAKGVIQSSITAQHAMRMGRSPERSPLRPLPRRLAKLVTRHSFGASNHTEINSGQASHRTPLWELTALPQIP